MPIHSITTEAEFDAFMESINAELAKAGRPIPQRPMHAWLTISRRYRLGLTMPRKSEKAKPSSYEGHDLSIRIFDWFDARFGERLNMDFSPGHTITVVRGDVYRLVPPYAVGTIYVLWDASRQGQVGAYADPVIYAPDCVEGLQPALVAKLMLHELRKIAEDLVTASDHLVTIRPMYEHGTGKQARTDLRASVDFVIKHPADYGMSRWHSLQAAEKIIKAYLALKGISYPRGTQGHDLKLLAGLASAGGLPAIAPKYIRDATCTGKVRYGDVSSTLSEACNAHLAARAICAQVGRAAVNEKLVKSKLPAALQIVPLRPKGYEWDLQKK